VIDEKVLDEILPVPEIDELKESIQQELTQEGFVITNFNSGGIFYTLMMILIWIRIELVKLLRFVLNNMFISHAEGVWLELKAADFSKKRKQPTKTRGYVTIKRSVADSAVKIAKGHVFKTEQDINGEELRFIALEDVIMQKSALNQLVLVEAEKEGSIYNVPVGQIKKSLIHISGIEEIINEDNWIVREGSDKEDIESLRSRTLNSWAELSTLPISTKLKNVAESVDGVLFATVDDLHPRGQGTIDIIVTSTAGQATEYLLELVRIAMDSIKGPYDNILVKSSETVLQDITAVLYISNDTIEDGITDRANSILVELLKINKGRNLNELYVLDISFALKKELPIKNVKILDPTDDVLLASDKVIILGQVNISIQRV
jgi:uncharacterized phage protein gp47/JayE